MTSQSKEGETGILSSCVSVVGGWEVGGATLKIIYSFCDIFEALR